MIERVSKNITNLSYGECFDDENSVIYLNSNAEINRILPLSPIVPTHIIENAIDDAKKEYYAKLLLKSTDKFPKVRKLGSYFIRGCVHWEDRLRYSDACYNIKCLCDKDKKEFEHIKSFVKKHSSINGFPK